MIALSSGHFSVDDQIADVVSFLSNDEIYAPIMEGFFNSRFPEYNSLEWAGAWVDTAASGVDIDYMSWVADWITDNTPVIWENGEPYMLENDDEEEDYDTDEYYSGTGEMIGDDSYIAYLNS
jgi:hypothetical protein